MNLNQIKGNTYWIRGGTNTGVYVFEDNTALLIDTGLGGKRQDKIIEIFESKNIEIKFIINTHEHIDHSGGNYKIKKRYKDIKIYSSVRSKIYIDFPDVQIDVLNGGRRPKEIMDEVYQVIDGDEEVDEVLYPNSELEIKGHKFKIIDCSGHTEGCIGIITDDKVAFLGDLLITKNSLKKFDFLFMCDYESQMKSLYNLQYVDFELSVLGHSRGVYTKEETLDIAQYNYKTLIRMITFFLETVKEPKTFDQIIKRYIEDKNLECTYVAYLEYRNSLNATVAYLLDTKTIKYVFEENILKYVAEKNVLQEGGVLCCNLK